MSTLIIGNRSQISYYLPKEYTRIPSRNIDYTLIKKRKWDRIYLCFAEQRTYLNEPLDFYTKINVDYTLEVLDKVRDHTREVVLFLTAELWNGYTGGVEFGMEMRGTETPYILSKRMLYERVKDDPKVVMIFPFNFNSPSRNPNYLWGKIIYSFTERKVVEVDCIDFSRDMIHPTSLANEIIKTENHRIIGSGYLHNIRSLARELFLTKNLDIDHYIKVKYEKCEDKPYYNMEKISDYLDIKKRTLYEYG